MQDLRKVLGEMLLKNERVNQETMKVHPKKKKKIYLKKEAEYASKVKMK